MTTNNQKPTKKSSVNMSNRERFQMFAEKRTNKAIHAIKSIGHLHNSAYYEWEEKDINAIIAALNSAIKETKSRFDINSQKSKDFTLPE